MSSNLSYPMKPRPGSKFMKPQVEKVVEQIISQKIGTKRYDYQEALQTSKDLSNDIQDAVKHLGYERYKLVVQTFVVEACQQGMRISSRCLWDPEVDNYAEYTYSNGHMHVTAIVFGLYWE